MKNAWGKFKIEHPTLVEFFIFFIISNGVTILQMVLMPIFKWLFGMTELININFQIGLIEGDSESSTYYIFNYEKGAISENGGGGVAYFLAVQITMAIAQIINFFVQRKVTFKSNCNILKAAFWYTIAYFIITMGAAIAQGFYKDPIYNLFMNTLGMGKYGETIADIITMIINCIISFWVYFPILKIIFKEKTSE